MQTATTEYIIVKNEPNSPPELAIHFFSAASDAYLFLPLHHVTANLLCTFQTHTAAEQTAAQLMSAAKQGNKHPFANTIKDLSDFHDLAVYARQTTLIPINMTEKTWLSMFKSWYQKLVTPAP